VVREHLTGFCLVHSRSLYEACSGSGMVHTI